MATLTYWVAECLRDSQCYSLRAKTKKECQALKDKDQREIYGHVHKVVVEYRDAFDLMYLALSEGGIYEGEAA